VTKTNTQKSGKSFPWSETKTANNGCTPKTTKVGEETKRRVDTKQQGADTIKTITTDVISHFKSICVSKEVTTTTTHYADKDVVEVSTTEYIDEDTYHLIDTTTETETTSVS